MYKRELERLEDYYSVNKVNIIAEFYCEDAEDTKTMKIKALSHFIA